VSLFLFSFCRRRRRSFLLFECSLMNICCGFPFFLFVSCLRFLGVLEQFRLAFRFLGLSFLRGRGFFLAFSLALCTSGHRLVFVVSIKCSVISDDFEGREL
jgi:hypothetical protein